MNQKAFWNAINNIDYDTVVSLLDGSASIDVNASENCATPLDMAMLFQNLRLVTLLLKKGANPDESGDHWNPVLKAIMHGDIDILAALLEYGANPNLPKGCSPLIKAIENNCIHSVRLLLYHGANVKTQEYTYLGQGGYYHSPLGWALYGSGKSNPSIVSALVSSGANVYERIPWGSKTHTLLLCAKYQRPNVVDIFYHCIIVDVLLAMNSLRLPIYVLLWILDWEEGINSWKEFKKVKVIETIITSIKSKRKCRKKKLIV